MSRLPWIALAATAGFLLAGTFPWDLQDHAHYERIAWLPFVTGPVKLRDVVLNVLVTIPIGLSAGAAVGRRYAYLLAGLLTFAVATTGEMLQVYSHKRFPSTGDIVANVLGALLGVALWRLRGALFSRDHDAA